MAKKKTKFYKKVIKAFGGAALYLDKAILKTLQVRTGDEVVIELQSDYVTIRKSSLSDERIDQLLNEFIEESKKRV